jgi:hypothetical protein
MVTRKLKIHSASGSDVCVGWRASNMEEGIKGDPNISRKMIFRTHFQRGKKDGILKVS